MLYSWQFDYRYLTLAKVPLLSLFLSGFIFTERRIWQISRGQLFTVRILRQINLLKVFWCSFDVPQCSIYLLQRRCFFCASPLTIPLSGCLTLAKAPLLSLSLNYFCLVLSLYCHLASQTRKFWVKCHFCLKKGKAHKKIHCKCLWKKGKNSSIHKYSVKGKNSKNSI